MLVEICVLFQLCGRTVLPKWSLVTLWSRLLARHEIVVQGRRTLRLLGLLEVFDWLRLCDTAGLVHLDLLDALRSGQWVHHVLLRWRFFQALTHVVNRVHGVVQWGLIIGSLWCPRILILLFFPLWVLALAKNLSLKVLEGNHHYSHVVEGLSVQRVLKHWFDSEAALLVNALCGFIGWVLLPFVHLAAVPNTFGHVFVWHFVEYTIRCHQDKVVLLMDLELSDLGISFHNVDVSATVGKLSFGVTKSSGHREATR